MNSRKPKYTCKIIYLNDSFGFITHAFLFLNKLAGRSEVYARYSMLSEGILFRYFILGILLATLCIYFCIFFSW